MRNLLMVCMIVSSFPLFAQKKEHKNEKKERIEAARVSFVTKKLELTPEESQAFWPLVNEMEAEIRTSRKAIKEQFKSVKEEDAKIDDETYKSLLEDMHDQHFLMVKIKNDYSKKKSERLLVTKKHLNLKSRYKKNLKSSSWIE